MSDVEVAGNGSILWKVKHGDGPKGRPLQYKQGTTAPNGDEVIVHELAEGKDPVAVQSAGVAGANSNSRYFGVTLRYDDVKEVQQVLADVQRKLSQTSGPWLLELKVPIIPRAQAQQNPPWEIKVHW